MLDKLYKKLLAIFTSGIMTILSVCIGIMLFHQFETEQTNEKALFRRLTTLVLYHYSDTNTYLEESLSYVAPYEKQNSIVCVLRNASGEILYQSPFSFPTSTDFLLDALDNCYKTTSDNETEWSKDRILDWGLCEIQGEQSDQYYGVPATIISKNNTVYHLSFLQQAKTMTEYLWENALSYLFLWIFSLLCTFF